MTVLRTHWLLFALLAGIFALWHTPVVLPLKVLVVFLHELSHAIAAWVSGGEVLEISVSAQQGGYAVTRGGSLFLILTAGYLGSLVLGVGLLLAAMRSDADRWVLGLFGGAMVLITILYVQEPFAALFCAGAGAVMAAIALFAGHRASDLVLRIIGMTSMIYVPFDIFDDTIARSALPSDAHMLAQEIGGTTVFWGGLWLLISLVVIVWCLRHALSLPAALTRSRP